MTQREVRVGKNFIREGDPLKVKLPPMKCFHPGFIFKDYDDKHDMAIVRTPKGHERYVAMENVKRVAVTKNGVRKEVERPR